MNHKTVVLLVAALCYVLNEPAVVDGRHLVKVSVFGYSNPTGRCEGCSRFRNGQRGCCDQFNTRTCEGDLLCDSYFTYCLDDLDEGECASGSQRMMSAANMNDGEIDFSQSTVLDLDNPLVLEGVTDNYSEVQVRVSVMDQDPEGNPDDLIDTLIINHDLRVGAASSRQNYTGTFNFVTMDMSIKVLCAPNFQGPDCSECIPGFAGDLCDRNINDCNGVSCSGNGVCEDGINMFSCNCDPGFTGDLCEINIDDCEAVNCSGFGQCKDLVNSFVCFCVPGFTGQTCEMNIDDCQVNSCNGHGKCIDEINTFRCDCEAGFTGSGCEVNIDECVGVTCSGNGECIDGVGSFTCTCNDGYTGALCEVNIDDCSKKTCSGNGKCVDGLNSLTCFCDAGFTGGSCEVDIDDCVGVNCSGRGRCEDKVNSFVCLCDAGFTGGSCEVDIDDCVGVSCSGNGECLDGVNSFTCECSPGHSGPLCAEELRGNNSTGTIIGGVLGIVLSLIIIFVVVLVLVLVMRFRNGEGKVIFAGRKTGDEHIGALPGDNPVYDRGDTDITVGVLPWTADAIHYENLTATGAVRGEPDVHVHDREFDNPIYGRNETENGSMHPYPHNYPQGVGTGPAPYHEFDNPIYGREIDDNTYSVISDSSWISSSATRNPRRNDYETVNDVSQLTDSEQVYAHIN